TFLADLDRDTVRTVAYVENQARGNAAIVALACDQVVMHPDATLGGENIYPLKPDEVEQAKRTLREDFSEQTGRSWSLMAALLDSELRVHRYQNEKTARVDFFCDDEYKEQNDSQDWVRGGLVSKEGRVLEVQGQEARDLNLASDVVRNFEEFKALFALTGDPRLVEPSWTEILVEALARPEFAVVLIAVGLLAIYAELQMPGIGIGGFIAFVCFLL